MFFERKVCPICEKKDFQKIESNIKNREIIKILNNYYQKKLPKIISQKFRYEILKCLNCSLLFQKFICDEKLSNELYENIIDKNKSFEKKMKLDFKNFNNFIREMSFVRKLFKKPNYKIKILEFGCGWGFWARLARSLNFKINTIEISNSRIKYLNQNGIENRKKIQNKIKYDFIYSDQVFEHLSFPHKEFSNLIKNLNVNGYILIKVPSSFLMNLKKKFNIYPHENILFPLEHINLYNKNVFNYFSKKYELKICNYKLVRYGGYYGIIIFLKNFFTNSFVLFKKEKKF